MTKTIFPIVLAAIIAPSGAAVIGDYIHASTYSLGASSEASGIAYSRDTNSLYVIGDEGGDLVEYSKTGQHLSSFSLDGPTLKPDTEGVSYLSPGKFLIADERAQTAYVYSYIPGGRGSFSTSYNFGPTIGNIGLEGISYDPLTNTLWGVKETAPEAVYQMVNFNQAGQSVIVNPGAPFGLHPSVLGVSDLSDVFALNASAAFVGTAQQGNLLFLSQESNLLVEVTSSGQFVSSLDLSFLGSHSIEGVTMDDQGNLFLCAEDTLTGGGSTLYALTVPETSSAALCALGSLALLRRRRR